MGNSIEWLLSRVNSYLNSKDGQLKFFVPGEDEVPVSGGKLSHMDIINIVTVALEGWITEGKFCNLFEKKLKKFVGLNHATLTNSGSSANLIAMTSMKEVYGIQEKSLIITSALAFPTTVAPIMQAGFIPYFVDVNPETLNPNISELIDLAKDPQVKGMILAHTLGFPIDLVDVSDRPQRRANHGDPGCR